MKKYVIFTTKVGHIGGGQIHTKNKMNYCKTLGYDVYIFSRRYDDVIIKELRPFQNAIVRELDYFPDMFPQKAREKIILTILNKIRYSSKDEVTFESHDLTSACWAEMICQKINGKNFVYLLGENFTEKVIIHLRDFLLFKYQRHELASIGRPEIMQKMFQPICNLSLEECYPLPAAAWNEAEDVEIPPAVKLGEKCDKTIGILGRIGKPFFLKAIEGIVNIAKVHPQNTFKVFLIGGSTEKKTAEEREFYRHLSQIHIKNLVILETGVLYPIPQKLLHLMDVCISSAGSAKLAGREVLTISMDTNGEAIGILGYDTMNPLINDNERSRSLEEYLQMVLFTDFKETAEYKLLAPLDPAEYLDRLKEQMEFIRDSNQSHEYFNFSTLHTGLKEMMGRILYSILGVKGLNLIRDVRNMLRVRRKSAC